MLYKSVAMKILTMLCFVWCQFTTVLATSFRTALVAEANTLLSNAAAGDTIILANGIYADAAIAFYNANGTENKPVTFLAANPGKVFFTGRSSLAFAGQYIHIDGLVWRDGGNTLGILSVVAFRTSASQVANHSILSNCAIINYNSLDTIDNKWVSIYGRSNTVSQCLFQDKKNLGATLTVWLTPGAEANHTISYNYFNGRQNGPDADNGLESMRIGDSKTSFEQAHCIVAFNRFEACDGEIEIISNKSFYNTYAHNTFYNCNGGLTLRHGNHCLVDGNVFDGINKPKAYGVRFIGEGHVAVNNYFYRLNGGPNENFRAPVTLVTGLVNTPLNGYFQVKRATISHNIFMECATPNIRIGATPNRPGATLAPDSVSIHNNVLILPKGNDRLLEQVVPATQLLVANNKVYTPQNLNKINGFETFVSSKIKRDGFDWIKDDQGNFIASVEDKYVLPANINAGAKLVPASIAKALSRHKYTFLTSAEVGPIWMR